MKDPEPTPLEQNRIMAIGHAESEFDHARREQLKVLKKNIKFDVYKDMYHLDSPLSKAGIKQCKESEATKILPNLELVFVSPLRRALETAYFMFKDHPNFRSI